MRHGRLAANPSRDGEVAGPHSQFRVVFDTYMAATSVELSGTASLSIRAISEGESFGLSVMITDTILGITGQRPVRDKLRFRAHGDIVDQLPVRDKRDHDYISDR
jgi:hypothetical protein